MSDKGICIFSSLFLDVHPPCKHVFVTSSNLTPVFGRISSDYKSSSSFGSVSLALNAAIFMGFKEMFTGYFPPGGPMPHFYNNEKMSNGFATKLRLEVTYGLCEMHWLYFRAQIQHCYMARYAERQGVKF